MLRIYAALEGIEPEKTLTLFEADNMFTFKEKLSNKLIDKICPIGEKSLKMCETQEDYLLELLDKGATKAEKVANNTLSKLK